MKQDLPTLNICWFRRDLRLNDNAALYHALRADSPVLPLFIFDTDILNHLTDKADARVSYIHQCITEMQDQLLLLGSSFLVKIGTPENVFNELVSTYNIKAVYCNGDYESYAIHRDEQIAKLLSSKNISFHQYKDHVLFEKDEVLKDDGKPYTVFTPYSKKWKSCMQDDLLNPFQTENYFVNFYRCQPLHIPPLKEIGFTLSTISIPPTAIDTVIMENYEARRNFPGINSTSRLGVHLRFGKISIRHLAKQASAYSTTFLNELIWRDFYQMILWHFPYINEGKSFKPAYDLIPWREDDEAFQKWCDGQTGYPIVDAGMRELNATGFMHNRVRMIVASFFSKHLLLNWRSGEAYFAEKLLDFDFASNNGGWQWAAGCGCDAAPYFRIFNPYLQTKKFDADFQYLRKWVPEFEDFHYPQPIVDHETARKRCLEVYSKALKVNTILLK